MTGADLANLVNEAALFAVRARRRRDPHAPLRVRPATGCSWASAASRWPCPTQEKEAIAYHEAGHAVCRRRAPARRPGPQGHDPPDRAWPSASPSSSPPRSATSTDQDYIEDSPRASRMGGRIAEELVFGVISTGANNDLVGSTELARKMVREWGMSRPRRPDGLGLAGRRCSSATTSCTPATTPTRPPGSSTRRSSGSSASRRSAAATLLTEHRNGLDLVARALLEHETIDGAEVYRLVDLGRWRTPSTSSASGTRRDGRGQHRTLTDATDRRARLERPGRRACRTSSGTDARARAARPPRPTGRWP